MLVLMINHCVNLGVLIMIIGMLLVFNYDTMCMCPICVLWLQFFWLDAHLSVCTAQSSNWRRRATQIPDQATALSSGDFRAVAQ